MIETVQLKLISSLISVQLIEFFILILSIIIKDQHWISVWISDTEYLKISSMYKTLAALIILYYVSASKTYNNPKVIEFWSICYFVHLDHWTLR